MQWFFRTYKNYLYILLFTLISSMVVWLPFVQQLGFLGIHIPNSDNSLIYRNFDGLLYVIAAKSWYLPSAINSLRLEGGLTPEYFAAHLPLYPGLIRGFAYGLGYVKSMMFVTLLSTVLLGWFFYYFVQSQKLSTKPLLLTFVFLMFPRFLVVRSIGSPESLFMLLILLSLFFFEKKKYVFAGLVGGLATMTKLPGILLLAAYGFSAVQRMREEKRFESGWLWLFLIPAGLAAVCLIYQQQMGDLFAYWHTGYVVPMPYPYAAFNASAKWVGTHWLEDVLLTFAIYALTVVYTYKHKLQILFYFSLTFFFCLIFVQHRDISRYALPMLPITCIVFEKYLTSKRTVISFILIVPAVYLYAWTFLQGNAMPVGNWAPFL